MEDLLLRKPCQMELLSYGILHHGEDPILTWIPQKLSWGKFKC